MSDEVTSDVFISYARQTLKTLRKPCLGQIADLRDIVLLGNQGDREDWQDKWYGRISRQMKYSDDVTCQPWNSDEYIRLPAETATECATMIMRALYLSLFQEFQIPNLESENVYKAIDDYILANKEKLPQRFKWVQSNANVPDWLRIIAMAERELSLLQPDLEVTLKQMEQLVGGAVKVKTMQNNKSTRPQPSSSSPGMPDRYQYQAMVDWFASMDWPTPPSEEQARDELPRLV